MNVISARDIQKKVSETPTLSFSASRIWRSIFADSAQTRHHRTAFRRRKKISLYTA
jgi:hypothetical protein